MLLIVLYASYDALDTTLRQGAIVRAGQAATQVAGLFSRSTQQSVELMTKASPCVATYLREPTPQHREAALACLAPLAPATTRRVVVWNAAGERTITLPDDESIGPAERAGAVAAPASPPPVGIGAMRADGDRALATVATPIDGGAPDHTAMGTLATISILTVTPRDALQRLVGLDARILFGNQRGDVWTDTTRLVPGPSLDGEWLGATSPLIGTPWIVSVEFPRGAVMGSADLYLRRITAIGIIVWLVAVVAARWFAYRMVAPLGRMMSAAEALAGGDYSQRVNARRSDEIGRLGDAFDSMTTELANAHRVLEQRVTQRTEDLNGALATLAERGRDRESYLATIVDGSADAIVGKDLHGTVTSWNKAAERIFGYTADEVIGTSILRLIPPERHDEEARILESIRRGDSIERLETVRVHKSGRLLDVALTVSPIRDATGRIVGVSKVARDVTEQKLGEKRLREREEQLRLYALHNPVAVAMFDRDMKYLVASNSWVEAFQLDGASLVGRSHYEVFPDLPSRWREIHQRCLAGAVEKCDQDPFPQPGGHIEWIRWEVRPWREADGAIGGIIIFSENITSRKVNEALLKSTEGRYRTLFDCAPDGILIADAEGRYVDGNPGICRMLGYERDELLELQATDIVVPEETENIELARQAVATRQADHREWRFRRKDGSVFVADVIASAMPDGKRMAMLRDVTERNEASAAVRRAEERMRFALTSAGVGIWDVDYSTGVVRWSEILEAQYGLAPGTFSGSFDAFMSFVHPDDRAAVSAAVSTAAKAGQDFSVQHRAIRADGTVRHINGAGRILLGPDGQPARGVGISLDVTERHTLEAQYQQAQKMEAVGRLAGGVAHDFNNLLTVILGHSELLMQGADKNVKRSASSIEKAAKQAAGLTRQLLAFSRKQIIEPKLIDLGNVVKELQPMLARLIGEDIDVVVELSKQETIVRADRGQMEQIAMNLAVNARDAMPHGGVLTIETALVELDDEYTATHLAAKPGPHVVLTVSDTGIGMSDEVQARLFEPFFTTKEVGKGTGLGLATVHGIVAGCGGSVGVYSEVGRGTSFKVYFPRVTEEGVAPEIVAAPKTSYRGNETILVVEDSELLRGITRQLLEHRGYTVLTAGSAEEAKTVFEHQSHIAVILTDVVMPGASGPQLIEELMRHRTGLKVIYMSGYTEEAIVHHGVLKSDIAFIHKPFTSETLAQKIREVLDRS